MTMKKLSKEVNCNENNITECILDLIADCDGGNWNDYNDGDIVKYHFDFNDENFIEVLDNENIKLDELKEFVGEGICCIVDEDIWNNVRFEGNEMIVEYEYVECD